VADIINEQKRRNSADAINGLRQERLKCMNFTLQKAAKTAKDPDFGLYDVSPLGKCGVTPLRRLGVSFEILNCIVALAIHLP